jgi:hypothetical protein
VEIASAILGSRSISPPIYEFHGIVRQGARASPLVGSQRRLPRLFLAFLLRSSRAGTGRRCLVSFLSQDLARDWCGNPSQKHLSNPHLPVPCKPPLLHAMVDSGTGRGLRSTAPALSSRAVRPPPRFFLLCVHPFLLRLHPLRTQQARQVRRKISGGRRGWHPKKNSTIVDLEMLHAQNSVVMLGRLYSSKFP